jgi:oxalate decarboxylase/phosphoglucose isomerase-like protein (cupin superfamily)
MNDGEELYVIEVDQGDGWTRVRRPADSVEGFVPTSYIHCVLNDSHDC